MFRNLAQRPDLDFEVFFAMLPDSAAQGAGFGVAFDWDIPLLDGYPYRVLKNVSGQPGVTTFRGCDTPGIHEELRKLKPDAVVVNGWVVKTCLQALWSAKRLGIPCIVRGEANNLRPRPGWKRFLQGLLVRRYDGYVAIGKANHSFYRSHGVAEAKIGEALYCIENSRLQRGVRETKARRAELRRHWKLPEGQTCFLFCGKFEEKKHPFELVTAFRQSVTSGCSASLLMVGDGPLRSACERYAADHELPIVFAGFLNQSEIVDAYVAADVSVLPSDHGETWGLVVNEGMACGLPAIVSDQVGCREDLIVEGKTGWSFPFGDWTALAELLSRVGGDVEGLRSMSEACLELIASYSPAAAADGIAAAIAKLLRLNLSENEDTR